MICPRCKDDLLTPVFINQVWMWICQKCGYSEPDKEEVEQITIKKHAKSEGKFL